MAYIIHSTLEENKTDINELKKIVVAQAAQIERNTKTIYQLLGGLYNQQTQSQQLTRTIAGLHGSSSNYESDDDESSDDDDVGNEDIWPTTRQGDEHEERLKEMEARFKKLEEQVTAMEQRQAQRALDYVASNEAIQSA